MNDLIYVARTGFLYGVGIGSLATAVLLVLALYLAGCAPGYLVLFEHRGVFGEQLERNVGHDIDAR